MIEPLILRCLSAATMSATVATASQIVDEKTLVPLGLLVGLVVVTCTLAWRMASLVINAKRDIEDLRRRMSRVEAKDTDA